MPGESIFMVCVCLLQITIGRLLLKERYCFGSKVFFTWPVTLLEMEAKFFEKLGFFMELYSFPIILQVLNFEGLTSYQ